MSSLPGQPAAQRNAVPDEAAAPPARRPEPARAGLAEILRRRVTIHRVAVAALTTAVAALYSVYGLAQFAGFHEEVYDLVIFDQAVRSYAHFRPGISIAKGVYDGFGPHFSVLGDHWSPVLALLAPFYWIHDSPVTLLVAQGVLFALAIPPLWAFTRRAAPGGGRTATAVAYFVCVAYGLSWPLAVASGVGFHEVAFVPVLTAVFFERMYAGRVRTALLAAGALLFVKEDMGLLLAGFGLWLLASRARVPRQRLIAGCLIAGGLAATWVATYVLRRAFGGNPTYYWEYSQLGRNVPQAALHVITHPLGTLRMFVTPRVKLDTLTLLFGAMLFLPLLSPITLAALPLLAERMLAQHWSWWAVGWQYNAFVVMVLVCAAVDGAARLNTWATAARARGRVHAGGSRPFAAAGALLCLTAVLLVPKFPLGAMLRPGFFTRSAQARAAAAADAAVPSGVTVAAGDGVGPELSGRDTVLLWDSRPSQPQWVVAQTSQGFTPFTRSQELRQVEVLERSGYQVRFERDGYLVLYRASVR
jgi:uncharacterized membrane protein